MEMNRIDKGSQEKRGSKKNKMEIEGKKKERGRERKQDRVRKSKRRHDPKLLMMANDTVIIVQKV